MPRRRHRSLKLRVRLVSLPSPPFFASPPLLLLSARGWKLYLLPLAPPRRRSSSGSLFPSVYNFLSPPSSNLHLMPRRSYLPLHSKGAASPHLTSCIAGRTYLGNVWINKLHALHSTLQAFLVCLSLH